MEREAIMPQIGDLVKVHDEWGIIVDKETDTIPEILQGFGFEGFEHVFTQDDITEYGGKNDSN